jgi:Putative adhesin
MSITEDATAPAPAARRAPVRLPGPARRASPWWWLVAASALLLLVIAAVLAVWWATSRTTQIVTYSVRGTPTAIELDVGSAPVQITGGATDDVEVRRTEEFAFGRRPRVTRDVDLRSGLLRITARCPTTVLATCDASFRIAVPDNVLVTARTSSGRVAIASLNGSARVATSSGDIAITGFCGFTLVATSASGDVSSAADCSPDRMELRSGSGDVHAVVPAGRYRVDAHNDANGQRVRNLTEADDASFAIQALSGSGEVTVESAP